MELLTQKIFKVLKLYKKFIKDEMLKLGLKIPPQHLKFLKAIGKVKQSKAKELSELFDCDKAHITRVLKKLEDLNLIQKTRI